MIAVQLKEPYSIHTVDIQIPTPTAGEVLLRVLYAGICGSDIGAFRGTNSLVSYPRVIGHEIIAEVISEPGENARGIQKGDTVVVDPYLFCGKCYPCSIGRTNCCNDLKVLGVHIDGGMSEYMIHPVNMLWKLPKDIPLELAAMAEPLTISLHGLHRGAVKAGEHVAIIGAGPIGVLAAMAAMSYGAIPIVLDISQARLDFARDTLGIPYVVNTAKEDAVQAIKACTGGNLAELVMECSGANQAVASTLDLVCNAGRITLTGWPKGGTNLHTDIITKKEVDIRGARTSAGEFEEAIKLIRSKKVDVRKLLTKVISLEEAPSVIEDIERNPGSYMKVIVSTGAVQ